MLAEEAVAVLGCGVCVDLWVAHGVCGYGYEMGFWDERSVREGVVFESRAEHYG